MVIRSGPRAAPVDDIPFVKADGYSYLTELLLTGWLGFLPAFMSMTKSLVVQVYSAEIRVSRTVETVGGDEIRKQQLVPELLTTKEELDGEPTSSARHIGQTMVSVYGIERGEKAVCIQTGR
jgi:hypothetical protein